MIKVVRGECLLIDEEATVFQLNITPPEEWIQIFRQVSNTLPDFLPLIRTRYGVEYRTKDLHALFDDQCHLAYNWGVQKSQLRQIDEEIEKANIVYNDRVKETLDRNEKQKEMEGAMKLGMMARAKRWLEELNG